MVFAIFIPDHDFVKGEREREKKKEREREIMKTHLTDLLVLVFREKFCLFPSNVLTDKPKNCNMLLKKIS
jgi:hypothetical protein